MAGMGKLTGTGCSDEREPMAIGAAPGSCGAVLAGVRALGLPAVFEVGGCVRDELLGREPKDIDVSCAGADPQELLAACQAAGTAAPLEVAGVLVGVRLRAPWTGEEGVEIALARTEVSTGPEHTDFQITPLPVSPQIAGLPLAARAGHPSLRAAIIEDLGRRDLTCNAIARDIATGEIIDPHGGQADIAAGVLRAVSPDTFRDDPLRCLRLASRIAKDGSAPDPATERMLAEWAPQVTSDKLSAERISAELMKILSGPHSAQALRAARDWGLLANVLPEMKPSIGFDQRSAYHDMATDEHTFTALEHADRAGMDAEVKLAVLLHDIGKPATAKEGADGRLHYHAAPDGDPLWESDPARAQAHEDAGARLALQACERLRITSAGGPQPRDVAYLVAHHMFSEERGFDRRDPAKQGRLARRFLARHGERRAFQLAALRECDLHGKRSAPSEDPASLKAFTAALRDARRHPTTLKELPVSGADLAGLGLKPGPDTGAILKGLLRLVVDDPEMASRERLMPAAARMVLKACGGDAPQAAQVVAEAKAAREARRAARAA